MTYEKLSYDLKTGKLRRFYASHAEAVSNAEWNRSVRLLLFHDVKRVYFRFFEPRDNKSDHAETIQKSFNAAEEAHKALLKEGLITSKWKALYWSTDDKVTDYDIRM